MAAYCFKIDSYSSTVSCSRSVYLSADFAIVFRSNMFNLDAEAGTDDLNCFREICDDNDFSSMSSRSSLNFSELLLHLKSWFAAAFDDEYDE